MSRTKERPNISYSGPKITFKQDGSTYVVLTFAKMKSLPISSKQVYECFKGYFQKQSDAERTLKVLERNECIRQVVPGKWLITPKGREVVYHVGRARPESVLIRGLGM